MRSRKLLDRVLGWLGDLLLLLVVAPFLAFALLHRAFRWPFVERSLRAEWARTYAPKGLRFLVIYSDSPKSKDWIESEVLPALGKQALVVNKSRNRLWQKPGSFENRAGDHWGAQYAPVVVFLPCSGRKVRINLRPAVQARWQRQDESLLRAELERIKTLAEKEPATYTAI